MTTIDAWFHGLPPFTKYYFCSAMVSATLTTFEIISPYSLNFVLTRVLNNLEAWRILTTFIFFGSFSFGFIISLAILVRFTRALETHPTYNQDFASFIWAILMMATIMLFFSLFTNVTFLGSGLLFALLYVWSKLDPQQIVPFYGGFVVKAYQFPFVLLGIRVLMGGNIMDDLIGLLAGHIYYMLKEQIPQEYGYDLAKTPDFFRRLILQPGAPRQQQAYQGRGFRLG
ncbi:unnamed protein product [Blepharisma stoltei]|uniref:Derlin n=1 Tax=Blepharisma stoltei TaxID=1481888 RepID=A0AAU9KB78_9CILI|nr:unnamed protein product [Blepharisma stoltei]